MAETDTASASEAGEPVTVKTLTGEIKTEIRHNDTSIPDVVVTGLDEQLAKMLISKEETELVLYGKTETVFLTVSNTTSSVSASEKSLMEKAAKEKDTDAVVCICLDISLYKQIEGESPIAITSIGTETVEVALTIPKQFRNTRAETDRSFYVVRVHSGRADVLQPTVTGNSLSFSTGLFSTYAIFYIDRTESISAADGTEPAAGTATLASTGGSANETSTPTAAAVTVVGTASDSSASGTDLPSSGSGETSSVWENATDGKRDDTFATEELRRTATGGEEEKGRENSSGRSVDGFKNGNSSGTIRHSALQILIPAITVIVLSTVCFLKRRQSIRKLRSGKSEI